MTVEAIAYSPELFVEWDKFCSHAINSTFLHTRLFLEYHGTRFQEASVLLVEAGEILGLFPAAVSTNNSRTIISHPGATYGGVVHAGKLTGSKMLSAIGVLRRHYASKGYEKLLYKVMPHIYMRVPAQDDLYALFRHGATRVRCDLSSTIDLGSRQSMTERRRRSLKKALKSVRVSDDISYLDELWRVLEQNLARKYDAIPVHSLEELHLLQERFPTHIGIRSAIVEGKVEAGVIFFNSSRVWHAQYIASSARGYEISALDAVFDSVISEAQSAGVRYFDFGTSNEEGGMVLNDGLYRFKSEFGGGGVVHEFYELHLL